MVESQTGQALALALGDYSNHSVHIDDFERCAEKCALRAQGWCGHITK